MTKKIKEFPTNTFSEKYSSQIKSIKIFLPKREGYDKYRDFVGRELLIDRLYNWLTDKKESGSYLVTGFRGMGKTTLVNLVTSRLTKEVSQHIELLCYLSMFFLLLGIGLTAKFWNGFPFDKNILQIGGWYLTCILCVFGLSFLSFIIVVHQRKKTIHNQRHDRRKFPNRHHFDRLFVDQMIRNQRVGEGKKNYRNIKINVNLGHDVLNERDVLSLIANNVKDAYRSFVKSLTPHFIRMYSLTILSGVLALTLSLWSMELWDLVREDFTGLISYNDYFHQASNVSDSWFGRLCWNTTYTLRNAYLNNPILTITIRILFFSLVWFVVWFAGKKMIAHVPTLSIPHNALKRLDELCDRIVATTDEELGTKASMNEALLSFTLFNRGKRKITPVADVREIETELANIINMIHDCPLRGFRADFIIVFDEMDKIDPSFASESKTIDMPEYTDSVQGFPGGMDSRERRKNVLRLLANIKLFISSAHAKFIFISGRELYDAYMADLSDRDFAISSIFSGVLNVDSFLSPEEGQTDVRSMSELYIANRLIPKEFLKKKEFENAKTNGILKKEYPSLRWYYEYLIGLCKSNDPVEAEQWRKDASYVVSFLHAFAAYLTHISNGSPKKIFLYFEKYIQKNVNTLQKVNWKNEYVVGDDCRTKKKSLRNDEREVLFFNPTQQKTINFVFFLTSPIMDTINNKLSRFGDQFLVSLSFVIDHIYKYHNRSFSWRNLEQIPDLLKTSKAPELRDQVSSIMEYLTQIHISKIVIGLDEYKFRMSIAEEISIMSKMSDEASAIFNFTLDESLPVIQHNRRLLEYYSRLARQDSGDTEFNSHYLPIIARIHYNLGDLHYWDEDYYSASLEYRAAVDTFHGKGNETIDKAGFLTKVRSSLKLGLAYEMRKLYPNAYMLYSQLVEYLINVRWVDENALGLDIVDISLDGWREKRAALVGGLEKDDSNPDDVRNSYREQFGHAQWDYEKLHAVEYGTNVDGIISSFARDLTKEKMKVIGSLSLFEEIRYVYQAILAKLSLLEKLGMSTITQTNIDLAEGEFRVLSKSINIREKFVVYADFYRKLAEILYYKNSLTILSQNQDSLYSTIYYGDIDLLARLDDYCRFRFQEYNDGNTSHSNALHIIRDVKFFFHNLDNPSSESENAPKFQYSIEKKTLKCMFESLETHLSEYFDILESNKLSVSQSRERTEENVRGYIKYNINNVYGNERLEFGFNGLGYCDYHRHLLRKKNLRPPCYACKYYCRSLEILSGNMFDDKSIFYSPISKSLGVLRNTFRSKLLYSGSTHLIALAKTLEGYGNVMFSCSSCDDCEGEKFQTDRGIKPDLIRMLYRLSKQTTERGEKEIIDEYDELFNKSGSFSRLDKSILYYWDAYRVYLIADSYSDAVDCLNRILTLLDHYIEIINFFKHDSHFSWKDETETISAIIGDAKMDNSLLSEIYRQVVRYSGYKYDFSNLSELNDIKWIYSKGPKDDVDLTLLSSYPNVRTAFLRIIEMVTQGNRYLLMKHSSSLDKRDYNDFISKTYPLIAPTYRYETTSYDEILGYYTKVRYNGHILHDIIGGNPLARSTDNFNDVFYEFRLSFYQGLTKFLSPEHEPNGLDCCLFEIGNDSRKKLELIEYLIVDTLICITHMTKVFTPHNHLTTYSKGFVGVVYNYFWEWSERYVFLYAFYQYMEMIEKGLKDEAYQLLRRNGATNDETSIEEMRLVMDECRHYVNKIGYDKSFGSRADQLYSRLSHSVDETDISTIYSNFTAEMALRYYRMAEEVNTEGEAYRDMIGQMNFLDDDMNNDSIQFNLACDRFLLNTGIIAKQRAKLDSAFSRVNVYDLMRSYINIPNAIRNAPAVKPNQFDHSLYINSDY